jgi:putative ABC transport system permease protein
MAIPPHSPGSADAMTFLTVVYRGLARRPVRTGLTLVGISIGIAAVVALVGMSRGFEASWESGMKSRGTDIVVNNMGSALMPKQFPAEARERIVDLPHIAASSTILVDLMSIENSEMMFVSAREWGAFTWKNLKILSGRLPNDGAERAVVLGQTAAEVLKKKVGDTLQLEAEELTVVGIVDGGAVVENGSVILSLPLFQEITGAQGKINIIDIRVTADTNEAEMQKLCEEINARVPEAKAVAAGEHIRKSQGYKMINAMSWGTSLLAVLVGVLGVMNTMLMTVFERKQEISVLLAIGWKRSRIVRMILWESAMLGLFGGIVGVVLGVVGVKLLQATPAIRGLLEPDLSVNLLVLSVVIAVIVGILSGLYPAWRSSRLTPSLALHG